MAAHVPSVSWSLRSPELGSYVRTLDEQTLFLAVPSTPDWMDITYIPMSRKDARLLAKRINACLDATTAKGKYGRGGGS